MAPVARVLALRSWDQPGPPRGSVATVIVLSPIRGELTPSDVISLVAIALGIVESLVLTVTVVVAVLQIRQEARHHRQDVRTLLATFRGTIHAQILSYLGDLNRMMLEYPEEVKGLFAGFQQSSADVVRQYCYVYGVLDLLNYIVLHEDLVDPYVRSHLNGLALLLYVEPRMHKLFLDVKDQQSQSLLEYLERFVEPLARAAMEEAKRAEADKETAPGDQEASKGRRAAPPR